MDIDLHRYDEFPIVTRDEHEAAVARAVGARTLDQLRAVTFDGIPIPALGAPQPAREPLPGRPAGRRWSIVQKVPLTDPVGANAQILDELAGGADAVDLLIPAGSPLAAPGARAGDDPDESVVRVFASVHLDMITLHLTGCHAPATALAQLVGMAGAAGVRADELRIRAGFDPFAAATTAAAGFAEAFPRFEDVRRQCLAQRVPKRVSLLASRGEVWHALGAADVQQLALAVATGIDHVRGMIDADADPLLAADHASQIEFRLVADQNQLLTMARIRAFRRLWALVLDGFGLPQRPAFVHAEASWRMLAQRDPWTNILRSTLATFAAATAGADAITTWPHTAAVGRPDAAARRLSRNVQTVLMEESNLHRIADPAAGAGGLEDLTDALAEAAWGEVQAIERIGGLRAALASGSVRRRIAETEQRRLDAVARRRVPITGTSRYPDLDEREPRTEPGPPYPAPAPGATRLSEPFEMLRRRADAAVAATGRRPCVLLVGFGSEAARVARTAVARSILASGGFAAASIETDGEDTARSGRLADALAEAGSRMAWLCSDTSGYETDGRRILQDLRAAGAVDVRVVAETEDDGSDGLTGGDAIVFDGMDVVRLLADLHDRAGSPAPEER